MELNKALEEIGFSKTEAKIYLYLLKNGASSQQKVSDDLSMIRQTVYDIMSKMLTKGQISQSIVGKRKAYSAIEPSVLLHKLKEKQDSFSLALPELEKQKQSDKPIMYSETFLGLEGLKNLFNMTLESKNEILWMFNNDSHEEMLKDYYWLNYAKKRVDKKIHLNLLFEADLDKKYAKQNAWKTDKKEFREVKKHGFLNKKNTSLVIFDDKVIMYSIENMPFGVIIQNKNINKFYKELFYRLWDEAKG